MNGKKSLKKILDRFCCCSCCRHFLFSNFQTYCNTIVQQHFIYFFSNFDRFFFSKFCLRMVDFFLFSYYKYIILFRSMLLMMMIPRIFFLIYPLTPINDRYWLNFFHSIIPNKPAKWKKREKKLTFEDSGIECFTREKLLLLTNLQMNCEFFLLFSMKSTKNKPNKPNQINIDFG